MPLLPTAQARSFLRLVACNEWSARGSTGAGMLESLREAAESGAARFAP
jgi:hypothetical protein